MRILCMSTAERGRGVFAVRDLEAGDVLEDCPVLEIPRTEEEWVTKSFLSDYVFEWGPEFDRMAFVLGLGMMYNHSYEPNARYVHVQEMGLIRFVAIQRIKTGDEITINYNFDPASKEKVWFEVKGQ